MAAKRKLPPKRPAQRAAKRKIASAPAAEVAALNPGAPFELKPEEIERSLVTGENRQLLERYFGLERYAEMQDLARKASARTVRGGAQEKLESFLDRLEHNEIKLPAPRAPGSMGGGFGGARVWKI